MFHLHSHCHSLNSLLNFFIKLTNAKNVWIKHGQEPNQEVGNSTDYSAHKKNDRNKKEKQAQEPNQEVGNSTDYSAHKKMTELKKRNKLKNLQFQQQSQSIRTLKICSFSFFFLLLLLIYYRKDHLFVEVTNSWIPQNQFKEKNENLIWKS